MQVNQLPHTTSFPPAWLDCLLVDFQAMQCLGAASSVSQQGFFHSHISALQSVLRQPTIPSFENGRYAIQCVPATSYKYIVQPWRSMDNLAKFKGPGDRQFKSVRLYRVPKYATLAQKQTASPWTLGVNCPGRLPVA